jgi:CRISPR-associated endonuclease/helicase Cas3
MPARQANAMNGFLSRLNLEDFRSCFEAIHGYPPYLWQIRLLAEVAESGCWPDVIAAPTGAGKTAVLDVALFHLALQSGAVPRKAPLRIVLAVDRRIIVDQAFERARRIRDALDGEMDRGSPLGRMATRLKAFSGDAALHVAELRGGIPREQDWARRPDQPTILCTTVDQLGSRLLFRGYGVSEGMAPVHAGLLGNDALLILDEAHLSRAFAETLARVGKLRGCSATSAFPWGWTALTATPRTSADNPRPFTLMAEERAQQEIERRLKARKLVRLISPVDKTDLDAALANEAREMMKGLSSSKPAPVVATVVNRVALARAVFEHLNVDGEAILLTGRVRPVERDRLVNRYRDRLEGRSQPNDKPLHVVATQCIEAGADFDFDGMVSQLAPLDALRQRFGRLARGGEREKPAPGAIVASKDEISKRRDDAIYGAAVSQTWEWLNANATRAIGKKASPVIDFGPDQLEKTIASQASEPVPQADDCLTPTRRAPLPRNADILAFAMTAPRPVPDPEPSLFLHGEFRTQADVALIWRADLDDLFAKTRSAAAGKELSALAEELADRIALLPPRAAEALALPHWYVRDWLSGKVDAIDTLADIETVAAKPDGKMRSTGVFLRWRGPAGDTPELIDASLIRPGDMIVLPSSHGGCDGFGWSRGNTEPVSDIAELAATSYEASRAVMRLHPALWRAAGPEPGWREVTGILDRAGSAKAVVASLVTQLGDDPANREVRERLERFLHAPRLSLMFPYGDTAASGAILVAPQGLGIADALGDAEPATEGDLGSGGSAVEKLENHVTAVVRYAEAHAGRLGLADRIVRSIAEAARLHDAGKADPRFQAFLRAIGRLDEADGPFAKSGRIGLPSEIAAARASAGLPRCWRHEVQSVRHAAAALSEKSDAEIDADLVLWLVGTHHGEGRPFFRHDDDWDAFDDSLLGLPLPASPGPDKLDFDWNGRDWAGLMAELQQRYGIWGLAFLETCLRLADHRASAAGGG